MEDEPQMMWIFVGVVSTALLFFWSALVLASHSDAAVERYMRERSEDQTK